MFKRLVLNFLLFFIVFGYKPIFAVDIQLVSSDVNKIEVKIVGLDNACVNSPESYGYYKIEGIHSDFIPMSGAENGLPYSIDLKNYSPRTSVTIKYRLRRLGGYWWFGNYVWDCDYSDYIDKTYILPQYIPVTNVQATDGKYQNKVEITWNGIATKSDTKNIRLSNIF